MDPRVKSLGKFYEDDREQRIRALGGIQGANQQDIDNFRLEGGIVTDSKTLGDMKQRQRFYQAAQAGEFEPAELKLNALEKVVKGGADLIQELSKPFSLAGERALNALGDKGETPGAKQLIKLQEAAKKRNLPEDLIQNYSRMSSVDKIQFLKLVEAGANDGALREFAERGAEEMRQRNIQTAGTAAEVSSLALGGGSLKGATGRQIAETVALEGTAGTVGGVGYVARENPDATAEELFTGGVFGGIAGATGAAALSSASKLFKGSTNKVLDSGNVVLPNGRVALDTSTVKTSALANLNRNMSGSVPANSVRSVKDKIADKFVSSSSPLLNWMKQNNFSVPAQRQVRQALANVKRSSNMSRSWLTKNENYILATSGLDKRSLSELNDYATAVREIELIKTGKKPDAGRLAKFNDKLQELGTPELQTRFANMTRVYRDMLDLAVDNGLMTREFREQLIKQSPNYIALDRKLTEYMEKVGSGAYGGKQSANLSRSRVATKLTESTREAVNPVETMLERSNRIFAEIERNKAAQTILEAVQSRGAGRQLVSAENAQTRLSLRKALKESKPLKTKLARSKKATARQINKLKTQLRAYKKELQSSKKRTVQQNIKSIAGINQLDDDARAAFNQFARAVNTSNTDELYEGLLQLQSTPYFSNIRRAISTRQNKLGELFDDLDEISSMLDSVNQQRSSQFKEIIRLADDPTSNIPSISFMKNGFKEVWEVPEEVAIVAKGMNKEALGPIFQALAVPNRVFTTSTTGANIAFALPNWVADQLFSFVSSPRARATHNPFNLMGSLYDMVGKSDLYEEFLRVNARSNFIDIQRNMRDATQQVLKDANIGKPIGKRVIHNITHPRELWRVAEDFISLTEQQTRFQNFRGMYNYAKKTLNMSDDEALQVAHVAARENSVDFFDGGDYSQALNSILPYFSAGIQGSRTLARSFRDRPLATSLKVGVGLQLPVMASTMYNLADPERAAIYADLQEYEKENNLIFILPGTDKDGYAWNVFKMKTPPGMNKLANVTRQAVESAYSYDPIGWGEVVKNTFGAFSPVDIDSPSRALNSVTPQIIKPSLTQAYNKDLFTGRDVVPEYLQDDEPFNQYFNSTSQFAKNIGKMLNISPARIEKFVSDSFGSDATKALLYGADVVVSDGEPGGRSPLENVLRRFSQAQGGVKQDAFRQTFDAMIKEEKEVSRKITEDIRSGNIDEANRKAGAFNQRVQVLRDNIGDDSRFVSVSDAQLKYLDSLFFPVEGGRLSESSIRYRKKQ